MLRDIDDEPGQAYVAVIGKGQGLDPEEAQLAYEVGSHVADRDAILVCGGMGGVMEAAAQGAKARGGKVVGILPGSSRIEANPYLDIAISTGLGEGRNILVVRSSDVLIAIGGEFGTLSEIALALKSGKPVVGIGTWELVKDGSEVGAIVRAETADEAVAKAFELIGQGRDE